MDVNDVDSLKMALHGHTKQLSVGNKIAIAKKLRAIGEISEEEYVDALIKILKRC